MSQVELGGGSQGKEQGMVEGDQLDRPPPHIEFHMSNMSDTSPAMLCSLQNTQSVISTY